MAAELLNEDDVIEYAKRSGCLSGFGPDDIARAITRATDMVRQAALNDYTSETFEELSRSNAPAELLEHANALALGLLTKVDAGRPQAVSDAWADAKKYLGLLSSGWTHYDEVTAPVLEKRGAAGEVTYEQADRKLGDPWSVP